MEQAIWRVGQSSLLIIVSLLPWFFGGVYMQHRAWLTLALFVPLVCAGLSWKRLAGAWAPLAIPLGVFARGLLIGASGNLRRVPPHFAANSATLRNDFSAEVSQGATSSPLSVNPPATRRDLALLVAAAASFALGALYFGDPKSLILLMGVLSSEWNGTVGVGTLQRASGRPWTYGGMTAPGGTQPFGPFISRNNAGGYLCICSGCSIGAVTLARAKALKPNAFRKIPRSCILGVRCVGHRRSDDRNLLHRYPGRYHRHALPRQRLGGGRRHRRGGRTACASLLVLQPTSGH